MATRTVMLLVAVLAALAVAYGPTGQVTSAAAQTTQCDDGIDNDGDGLVDYIEDPECQFDPDAAREGQPADCGDGVDNDADGAIDRDDPGCEGDANAASESDPAPQRSTTRVTVARA